MSSRKPRSPARGSSSSSEVSEVATVGSPGRTPAAKRTSAKRVRLVTSNDEPSITTDKGVDRVPIDRVRDAYESEIVIWRKVIPNGVTMLGTLVGLYSIHLAMNGRFEEAIYALCLSGIADGLDGPIARALHGTSQFGAELDSLNDFLCFGVAAGMITWFWGLKHLGPVGFLCSAFYTICMMSRLARFNAGVDFNRQPWSNNYFMGVPAPAGAGLALCPIAASLVFGRQAKFFGGLIDLGNERQFAVYLVGVALLLVSRLPTFSSKMIKRQLFKGVTNKLLAAVPVVAVLSGLYYNFMATLLVVGGLYLASIPVTSFTFQIEQRKASATMRKLQ